MDRLSGWLELWQRGALALFLSLVAVGATGLLVGIAILATMEMMGVREQAVWPLLLISAVAWAPPVVAKALSYVPGR